jgi:hypothetical protein
MSLMEIKKTARLIPQHGAWGFHAGWIFDIFDVRFDRVSA